MKLIKKIKTAFGRSKETPKKTPNSKYSSEKKVDSPTPQKSEPKRRDDGRRNDRRRDDRRRPRSDGRRPERRQHDAPKKKVQDEVVKRTGKPFSELGLHPDLLEKLKKTKFVTSSEVQEKAIPEALKGKNIFCSSETGSGKTLAFLLPMMHKFYTGEIHQALIICPTREIAIQIEKTLLSFEDETLTSALVIGGTNVEAQKKALRQYPKILVATPGRLLDMLNSGLIWLEHTGYVVLDEADRMLDMGFEPDLISIHEQLSGTHQTVLFSATLFPEIKKMAKRYADNYEEIVIGNPTSVAGSVEHVLVEINEKDKFFALKYLISRHRGKMMVFCNTIKDTSNITSKLEWQRVPSVGCIHSKIDQSARMKIIENFRSETIKTLLASDVASRGIDIPNVELVINYDIPNNSEEYIHRVGRTGRAGKSGVAISFYSPKDKRKLEAIEKLIKGKIKRTKNYRYIL